MVDLIGDDNAASTASAAASSGPSTHDLLADIFGSSAMEEVPPSASTAAPAKSANADIMSLFGGSSASTTSAPPTNGGSNTLLDLMSSSSSSQPTPSAQAQSAAAAAGPAKAQLQSYSAYDKNGLKITLTPKVSPTQSGMVQILARFTASEDVQTVNLQVAVPKVSHVEPQTRVDAYLPDTTVANASNVKRRYLCRRYGDSTNAYTRPSRREWAADR